MNPVVRGRIPASLRKLLTDIAPREESSDWTDAEPESVTRDGIELPARGTTNPHEFLSPAVESGNGHIAADDAGGGIRLAVCGLCLSKPSCYTCPRCNVPYCGLACYRGPQHTACSEEFYKESVMQELKGSDETETEGRKRMQDILLKLRRTADGDMERVVEMEGLSGDDPDETRDRAQVLELLSRLAEIQSCGEGSEEEIQNILAKLQELGGDEDGGNEELGVDLEDADEGEANLGDKANLVERFAGMDIDAMSEEDLWKQLSSQEKELFKSLVRSGAVAAIVPLWKPWWERHEERGGQGGGLVVDLEEGANRLDGELAAGERGSCTEQILDTERESGIGNIEHRKVKAVSKEQKETPSCVKTRPKSKNVSFSDGQKQKKDVDEEIDNRGKKVNEHTEKKVKDKHKNLSKSQKPKSQKPEPTSSVPPVDPRIPPLSSLSSNPSPLVRYSLVNVLFGYAFSLRLFNGNVAQDVAAEFCQTVLALSEALNSGRVFNSIQEALEAGQAAVNAEGYFDLEDANAPDRAVEAVAHILTGQSRSDAVGYCLAALSQLRSTLSQARSALPKGGEDGHTRKNYFLAMKKCEFYQAWVADNREVVSGLAAGLWREHGKREGRREGVERGERQVEDIRKKTRAKGKLIEEM